MGRVPSKKYYFHPGSSYNYRWPHLASQHIPGPYLAMTRFW